MTSHRAHLPEPFPPTPTGGKVEKLELEELKAEVGKGSPFCIELQPAS